MYAISKRSRSCQPSGFTLIELLVVISIIALLISILLPALSKSRISAQNVIAGSDMGSIGKAIFIYAADNKGTCPTRAPYQYNNGSANNPVVSSATDYQLFRSAPGWTLWANTNQGINFGYGTYGEGPLGLGVLISRPDSTDGGGNFHQSFSGYLATPIQFFHPLMRNVTTGGGTARHYYNAVNNFGKFLGDPNIAGIGGGISNWLVGASGNNNINGNGVMYRGGEWSPVNATTATAGAALPFDNMPGYNKLAQNRPEEGNFNQRVLLCNGAFETQIFRQDGVCYFMTGDGAVRSTKQPEFWYANPPSLSSSAGIAVQNANSAYNGSPQTVSGITTTIPAFNFPGGYQGNSPGLGAMMNQMSYIIESRDLGLY